MQYVFMLRYCCHQPPAAGGRCPPHPRVPGPPLLRTACATNLQPLPASRKQRHLQLLFGTCNCLCPPFTDQRPLPHVCICICAASAGLRRPAPPFSKKMTGQPGLSTRRHSCTTAMRCTSLLQPASAPKDTIASTDPSACTGAGQRRHGSGPGAFHWRSVWRRR